MNWKSFSLGVLVVGALAAGSFWFCKHESLYIDRNFHGPIEPGCILVGSMDFALESLHNPQSKPRIFLVNKKREIVHSWKLDTPPFSVKLDKTGNLWVLKGFSSDAREASLHSLNFKGDHLVDFSIENANHDFDFLPDNNFLIIVRSSYSGKLPESYSKASSKWETDTIQVVDLNSKKVLRTFDLSMLIDFSVAIETIQTPTSVLQVNSVRYIAHNPINQRPAILISARLPSTVALIDYETGELIWKNPKGAFDNEHDPSILSNGDLLLFNNGTKIFVTSVIQYNLKTNSVAWKYQSFDREDFFNHYNGGAQRLPNGNTLITVGSRGYVFEVDPEGRKVWDWFNTTMVPRVTDAWPYASIFRAIQYLPEDPEIAAWKKPCSRL